MRIESVGGKAPLYTDKESQRGVKGQKQSDRQRQDTLGATCRVHVCVRVGVCSRVCVCVGGACVFEGVCEGGSM